MNRIRTYGRRALLTLAMSVLALAGLVLGHVVVAGKDAGEWSVPLVTVDQLLRNPGLYRGRAVSLVATEGQKTGDPVALIITRSDIHLHDGTGSVLLLGGWQDWNRWRTGGCRPYSGGSLDIDACGTWTIHEATVNYTGDGMPYLTVAR